jgi:hypothetical protein
VHNEPTAQLRCHWIERGEADMESQAHRMTIDALLRDLVGHGLVRHSDRGANSWTLTESAQRRLNDLAVATAPVDAESILYLNRRCAICRERTPTRLRQERYLCKACVDSQLAGNSQGPIAS